MQTIQTKNINVENEAQDNRGLTFRFYEVMGFPLPLLKVFFSYSIKKKTGFPPMEYSFSRKEIPQIMSDFLFFLQKWNGLYRNFPFVKQIFLANSITFNALKSTSDIDLFVITQEGRIWIARFFMSIIMFFFQIKRTQKSEYKKFCLSFFVDEEHLNLENLLLNEKDIYLPYWIAHLVPLYQEQGNNTVFESNTWITRFLPNFPKQQSIFLGNKVVVGVGFFKQFIEWLLRGKLGDFFEKLIKRLRLPRIKKLQKKNPELHQGVLIADGILKFHYDKRRQYSELFFS